MPLLKFQPSYKPMHIHDKISLNYFKNTKICVISIFPHYIWNKAVDTNEFQSVWSKVQLTHFTSEIGSWWFQNIVSKFFLCVSFKMFNCFHIINIPVQFIYSYFGISVHSVVLGVYSSLSAWGSSSLLYNAHQSVSMGFIKPSI